MSLILLSTLFYKLTLKIFGFKYFSFATKYNQVRAIRIKFEQSTFFYLNSRPLSHYQFQLSVAFHVETSHLICSQNLFGDYQ